MSQGVYVLGGKCPGGKCPGGKCPGGICPWGKCPGGTCPGGLCPRTVFTIYLYHTFIQSMFHVTLEVYREKYTNQITDIDSDFGLIH